MGKISARLEEKISAGTGTRRFKLIVNLTPGADWDKCVHGLERAGVDISGQEQAIGVVFGSALANAVPRIAEADGVDSVESDEEVKAI